MYVLWRFFSTRNSWLKLCICSSGDKNLCLASRQLLVKFSTWEKIMHLTQSTTSGMISHQWSGFFRTDCCKLRKGITRTELPPATTLERKWRFIPDGLVLITIFITIHKIQQGRIHNNFDCEKDELRPSDQAKSERITEFYNRKEKLQGLRFLN